MHTKELCAMKSLFDQRLILRTRLGVQIVLKGQLVYLKGSGSYTDYYILKDRALKRNQQSGNLAIHAAKLDDRFLRISKSCYVNLDFVEYIGADRSVKLSVPTSEPLTISVRCWKQIQRFLG